MRLSPYIVPFTAAALLLWSGLAFAFLPSDTDQHWARESINRLVELTVAAAYEDGTFRPDQPMTRAEFAQLAAAAFPLEDGPELVFADAQGHPAGRALALLVHHGALIPGNDTTVRPDTPITRAEAAYALVALLGLDALEGRVARLDDPLFDDVPRSHPGFDRIQIAARLGLFPPFMRGRLWPDEFVARGEAAYMVDAALRLERHTGRVERIDTERRVLWLSGPNQIQRSFPVSDLEVFEPESKTPWTALTPGRELHLVVNRFGRPLIAWAEPEGRYAGLRSTLRELAVALLTPEQLRAILDGDWSQASQSLKLAVYKELVARGVRPWEADALLAQDWPSVQELGLARVSEAVGEYLNVSPQLVAALIDRDWATARDYAQIEALERLLQAQLFDLPAETGSSSSANETPAGSG